MISSAQLVGDMMLPLLPFLKIPSLEEIWWLRQCKSSVSHLKCGFKSFWGKRLHTIGFILLCVLNKIFIKVSHSNNTPKKMKFSIHDFFSKCDQIHRFLRIWSHLLKNFIERFLFRHLVVGVGKILLF